MNVPVKVETDSFIMVNQLHNNPSPVKKNPCRGSWDFRFMGIYRQH